jgi:uncharacterized protein (TIGR03083 family)
MNRSSYLARLESDGNLLLAVAEAADLDADVPTCPGWTVRDAVEHVAAVYEHKIACIRLGGARPETWPSSAPDGDALGWLVDAHRRILVELTETDPTLPSWTWWPPDQTVGFWSRRMAMETAVHRVDVQAAGAGATAVDPELATDGIDEVLTMMLADGDWSEEGRTRCGRVIVQTGNSSWFVEMTPERVVVTPDRPLAADDTRSPLAVTGPASDLFLWLWGRGTDAALRVEGEPEVALEFRERLARATQ